MCGYIVLRGLLALSSNEQGNARSLRKWDGDEYRFLRFLFLFMPFWGVGGNLTFFMIVNYPLQKRWLSLLMLFWSIGVWGAGEVPCFVFTGDSGKERALDLEKYNRISFSDNSFTVTSSVNSEVEAVSLDYSMFNRVEFKNSIPSETGGIVSATGENRLGLIFASGPKTLRLVSPAEDNFAVSVYSATGQCVASSALYPGEEMSLSHLPSGIYIAVANNEDSQLTLKFILK